jgi:hypothetical protein
MLRFLNGNGLAVYISESLIHQLYEHLFQLIPSLYYSKYGQFRILDQYICPIHRTSL